MEQGTVCWSELATRDVEAAKAHYAALVGWTYEAAPMDGGTYWIASRSGRPTAGIMDVAAIPHEVPPHWLTYIAVDDMDAAVATVSETGGHVIREPFAVPNVGRIAIVSEPGGGGYGLLEPEKPAAAT
ncbi:VOC family protein [Acuticoccus sp. M5D2P5]|uniref:VOC family protein n=1 Tax=Acuticoccus kalidii TaxID=2910977 RepID=UPI001F30D95D|nr:VOC family protein [Acuticoccus kalidii]MCF3936486.1 VOC family protein [Acuticoccus kalidii]